MPSPVLNESIFQREAGHGPGWQGPSQAGVTASAPERGRTMTIGGTMTATAVLFILLLITASFGYASVQQVPPTFNELTGQYVYAPISIPIWTYVAAFLALIPALVMFFKPNLARFLAPLYALAYGGFVGAISAVFNYRTDGIVLMAVGATFAVFAVMLFLYATRIIKVTKRYLIAVYAGLAGVFLLFTITWIASLFGANIAFWNQPTPLGIGISVLIVGVAAMSLAVDFAFIEQATNAGAPKYMEWFGAYGLLVGLVFLYLQILRLLALVNSR